MPILTETQATIVKDLRKGAEGALKDRKDPRTVYVTILAADLLETCKAVEALQEASAAG